MSIVPAKTGCVAQIAFCKLLKMRYAAHRSLVYSYSGSVLSGGSLYHCIYLSIHQELLHLFGEV
jgi:hypothetical protein